MRKRLQKIIPQSAFAKNVLTLMTGTTIAQAIPVAISPILTRIYSPEDFGVLALFVSITTIMGAVVNGRYELAIVLPEEEEKAQSLLGLCIIIAAVISLLLFLIILPFHALIVENLNNADISRWLYFVPLVVFLLGVFNAFNYYFSRKKQFRYIAQGNVLKSSALASGQLGFSLLQSGAFGLVLGRIFSTLFAPLYFLRKFSKTEKIDFKWSNLKSMAKRYVDFPKYDVWAGLLNNFSLYCNEFIIPILYNTTTLGYFAIIRNVFGIPFLLISSSVSQVFFKEATELKIKQGNTQSLVKSTTKKLAIVSVLGFSILFLISEELFAFVFGEEWRIAGVYIRYLIPLYMIRLVVSPLTIIHSVYEKIRMSFYMQVLMVSFIGVVFFVSFLLDLDFVEYLKLYSLLMSLFYLLRWVVIFKISKASYYD